MTHPYQKFFLLLALVHFTRSSRILGIYTVPSKSHQFIHETITKGLASRGHEIIIISNFRNVANSPNHTTITLNETVFPFKEGMGITDVPILSGFWSSILRRQRTETALCHSVFQSDYIQELVHSKGEIDLIMAEVYDTSCYHLLAHVLDVPIITVSPLSLLQGVDYFVGNPHNPSNIPVVESSFTTKMNFIQRLQNSVQYAILYFYHIYVYNSHNKEMAKRYFNTESPPEEILNKRTALAIHNNHLSFIGKQKTPNVIDIGGIHIKPANTLPEDLEDFIEQAPHGVILFTFGSTIHMSSIPEEKLKIITQVFSSIPQRVLWRVDELNCTNIPENVKLSTWLPQRDILEHKNVIAFISHCGLLGTLEAIHTATPVIGIPFVFDQFQNINTLIEKGAGIYVDYHSISADTFASAIKEIVSSKYRENMRKLSRIFKDRPMSPLDEAMYWIEYVLKYKGAPHLRIQAADMPLYQYLSLDVVAFLSIVILNALFLLRFVLKIIVYLLQFQSSKNKID